jgi:hypothetical protein
VYVITSDIDIMVMLSGWELSAGAVVEHTLAASMGMHIIYL